MSRNTFEAIRGGIVFAYFVMALEFFPTGEPLVADGKLTNFWVLPMAFLGTALVLDRFAELGRIPSWFLSLVSAVAGGTWLGLSLGAVLILNAWYADPGAARWEPLFAATGLSAAGVLAADRRLSAIRKAQRSRRSERLVTSEMPTGRPEEPSLW